jgi:energy-converting hydrogenase Eha subunit A
MTERHPKSPLLGIADHDDRKKRKTWLLYWASICPVICGALGPTLSLLAIAGCTDRWRYFYESDGDYFSEKDPTWIIATTVVAIVLGVIANIFLALRMLARGNPALNQYLSITLWSLQCIINVVCIVVFVKLVGDGGNWEYAQGFYMTICSACMSFMCAILLAMNTFLLPEFGKRGNMGLSGPQRVFVIQIMIFMFWLTVYPLELLM